MQRILVWDYFVRFGHWALAAGFLAAYLSAEEIQWVHEIAGYTVAAIVLARIVWGFVGPRRARFANFVCGPRRVFRYLFDLLRFRSPRYVGHSPAGGAMVVALLFLLTVTTAAGMTELAMKKGEGPLALLIELPAEPTLTMSLDELIVVDNAKKEWRRKTIAVKNLHETFANLTLFFIIAHILGVALASFAHRENLVTAMFTGRKRGGDAADL
ncbi:MAG: cytochrome b/b6 domain-containing protein [Rhodospirillaceae bacterium]|nr:cytochrome b/b6 domain-containing protein [Rhodospirillaceae bacterium]